MDLLLKDLLSLFEEALNQLLAEVDLAAVAMVELASRVLTLDFLASFFSSPFTPGPIAEAAGLYDIFSNLASAVQRVAIRTLLGVAGILAAHSDSVRKLNQQVIPIGTAQISVAEWVATETSDFVAGGGIQQGELGMLTSAARILNTWIGRAKWIDAIRGKLSWAETILKAIIPNFAKRVLIVITLANAIVSIGAVLGALALIYAIFSGKLLVSLQKSSLGQGKARQSFPFPDNDGRLLGRVPRRETKISRRK